MQKPVGFAPAQLWQTGLCKEHCIHIFNESGLFTIVTQLLLWTSLLTSPASPYMSVAWCTHAVDDRYSSTSYLKSVLWLSERHSKFGAPVSVSDQRVQIQSVVSSEPGWKTSSCRADWVSQWRCHTTLDTVNEEVKSCWRSTSSAFFSFFSCDCATKALS